MAQAPHPSTSYASSPPTGKAEMMMDERLIEAKLQAVEARTDTKFERLIGKIDALSVTMSGVATELGKLDTKIGGVDVHARSAKTTIIATIIGAAIGIVGLAFAAVSIFQSAMGTTATAYQSGIAAAEAQKK